jgi:hypothetical protein
MRGFKTAKGKTSQHAKRKVSETLAVFAKLEVTWGKGIGCVPPLAKCALCV